MFSNFILPSLFVYLILFVHSSYAVPPRILRRPDSRIAPEERVIALSARNNLKIEDPPPPPFQNKDPHTIVLLLDSNHCLEIVQTSGPWTDDPYFASFLSLGLNRRVESVMGSVGTMGVILRRIRLVVVEGRPPLVLRLDKSTDTHVQKDIFDRIIRALSFAEEKGVAPTTKDLSMYQTAPDPKGAELIEFKEGMVGTASPEDFQEDRYLPALPWQRKRQYPFVLFLNKDHWCLEILPDIEPFNQNEFFVSFTSLGVGDAVMNFMMQGIPMGVLLRRIHLRSADGKPPVVKWLPGSKDKQLNLDIFHTIFAALLCTCSNGFKGMGSTNFNVTEVRDRYKRAPVSPDDRRAMYALAAHCMKMACLDPSDWKPFKGHPVN